MLTLGTWTGCLLEPPLPSLYNVGIKKTVVKALWYGMFAYGMCA